LISKAYDLPTQKVSVGPFHWFREGIMEFLTGISVIVVATILTTWFNDHVSTSEYISDEA